jgi:hypothetical protein
MGHFQQANQPANQRQCEDVEMVAGDAATEWSMSPPDDDAEPARSHHSAFFSYAKAVVGASIVL